LRFRNHSPTFSQISYQNPHIASKPANQPPPPPEVSDGVAGVAPHATVISIRQSSLAFSPVESFADTDPQTRRKAGDVASLSQAIVHAANLGADVINISQSSCMPARKIVDQRALGAAIRYAAIDKDAVIVAAAGNLRGPDSDCQQNPLTNPLTPGDPRNWAGVTTVVTPAWFSDYVLTVGAVNAAGTAMPEMSIAGPWVGMLAPVNHTGGKIKLFFGHVRRRNQLSRSIRVTRPRNSLSFTTSPGHQPSRA
jgi:membrane-anchored mycosin MYCP